MDEDEAKHWCEGKMEKYNNKFESTQLFLATIKPCLLLTAAGKVHGSSVFLYFICLLVYFFMACRVVAC